MGISETLKLGLVGLGEWARIGIDAINPNSLAIRPEKVMEPGTLNHWLNAWPVAADFGPVDIARVTRQDIPSVSSNCQNLVLSLEQSVESGLPDSVFVKVPMTSPATQWFLNLVNSWRLESWFFEHIARELPIRTPVTYATHCRGSRFFLIQENLRLDPEVQLFTNLDMMAGPSLDLVNRCLDTFARLHSVHYGLNAAEREQILPLDYHMMLSPSRGALSRLLNQSALKPCLKKQPGVMPDAVQAAYRTTLENWDRLLEHWYSGPLSLLHGDSHLGNFFVSGDEMGMLDWQAAHWGKGVRDVQYFLIDALPQEVLAANERQLLDYYVERRAVHGAAIDGEEAWQDYRSFTYHTLMTIVVSIGFGALNEEQDELMVEILKRSVAAVERVDYPGWLRDFLN